MTSHASKKVTRALLGTLSRDVPPAHAKEKAYAAFGIAAGVGAVSTAATGETASVVASSAAGAAAPAAAAVVKTAVITVGTITKALIAGALTGAVVIVQVDRGRSSQETSTAHPTSVSTVADAPPAPTFPRSDRGATVPTGSLSEAPAVAGDLLSQPQTAASARVVGPWQAAVPARSVETRTPSALEGAPMNASAQALPGGEATPPNAASLPLTANADPSLATLTDELDRLDRARAALQAGAPARAASELDRYDAEFVRGSLRPEATVLRIEVLMKMGDEARARALAGAFAAAHPTSGYLPKIRLLVATHPDRRAP